MLLDREESLVRAVGDEVVREPLPELPGGGIELTHRQEEPPEQGQGLSPFEPGIAFGVTGEEHRRRVVSDNTFQVRQPGRILRGRIANQVRDTPLVVKKAHPGEFSPLAHSFTEGNMPVSAWVADRLDTKRWPLRRRIIRGEAEPRPGVRKKAASQVIHDNIVVAVADKEHCVFAEHLLEEPRGPRIREVGVPEIAVCHDEARWRLINGPMQVNYASEIASQR